MPLQHETTELQIPRGRVYFQPEGANGERAFGNCPSVTLTIATTKAEHFSSQTGLRQKDASLDIEVNRTGQLNCDHMSMLNAATFFAGAVAAVAQANTPVAGAAYTVTPGEFYQLGATTANPFGARNIASVVVKDATDTTTYVVGTDYEVDLALGRLQILEAGTIAAGVIHVSYTPATASWEQATSGSATKVSGALRIVADNASGENRDWYMPSVNLTPSGDMPIINEDTNFATMAFDLEVLKPANQEAIYIGGRPA